ncbi:MAG TPA: hypothetical protein VGW35_11940 [Methylomirabilota bacterium]|nr:hypothetical protein [Methylomirabilota bacterium]
MPPSPLPDDAEARLAELGAAEVVFGVLSYQNARTIGEVVRSLEKGARTHFPDARGVLVHSDAGSTDETVDAAARSAGDLPVVRLVHGGVSTQRAMPPAHGVPGGDVGLRGLCVAARRLSARAVLLVGADLRSLPDIWMDRLLRPIWGGELDFVTPLYARPALDGTLTTCLLYPLTRALYGSAVRHVVPSEAALSAALVARLADGHGWSTAATRSAPLYLGTTASATGARLGEAWLGARDAEGREGRLDLGDLVSEVVGTAFALAELYEEQWREAGPRPAPRRFGESLAAPSDTPPASQARMVSVFRQGLRDLVSIWEQALSAGTLGDLYPLGDLAPEEFVFSADLWARVVYDFLLAYHFRVLHRDHLLRSLVPLYMGRTAALCREASGLSGAAQARLLERQARAFERARADFADRWR